MIRVLLLLCMLVASPAAAEVRPQGLMWNRTGLPAIFPLQIRSDPGQDYYLVLSRADTGAPALAAYVRGGAVFRVLVPPGDYHIAFAHGTGWRGEEALFGEGTKHIKIAAPLRFGAEGRGRRVGNLIDLRREAGTVQAFGLCRQDADSEIAAPQTPRGLPPVAPAARPAAPETLPETRRPAQVFPPPDRAPPRALGAQEDFAAPFVSPPRAAIALPQAPASASPRFADIRPRAPSKGIRQPRWKICD